MLAKKTKGMFIEWGSFTIHCACTNSLEAPLHVDSLHVLDSSDNAGFAKLVSDHVDRRRSRYLSAHCSVYPDNRFFRRHTLDPSARTKDPALLNDILQSQFRLDPGKNRFAVINAANGAVFNPEKPVTSQKELLFCGADFASLGQMQLGLTEAGVFPLSMQLGSLSVFGGLRRYRRWQGKSRPVLILEMGADQSQLFIVGQETIDLARPAPFGVSAIYPMVQQELGLKDLESARKLVHAGTFDFSEIGAQLLRRILKELQASVGFYEVQTGQAIANLMVMLLPDTLDWVGRSLAHALAIEPMTFDYAGWLAAEGIHCGEQVLPETLDARSFGLISLMLANKSNSNGAA
jgi:hypothetical protein